MTILTLVHHLQSNLQNMGFQDSGDIYVQRIDQKKNPISIVFEVLVITTKNEFLLKLYVLSAPPLRKKTRRKLYCAVSDSYFAYNFIMAFVVQVSAVARWSFVSCFISFQGFVRMTFRNHLNILYTIQTKQRIPLKDHAILKSK